MRLDDTVTRATLGACAPSLTRTVGARNPAAGGARRSRRSGFPKSWERAGTTPPLPPRWPARRNSSSRESPPRRTEGAVRERIAQSNEEIARARARSRRPRRARPGSSPKSSWALRTSREEPRHHRPRTTSCSATSVEAAGRAWPVHRRHRPRPRPDQRNRVADHPARSGLPHRGAQGSARHGRQDCRTQVERMVAARISSSASTSVRRAPVSSS